MARRPRQHLDDTDRELCAALVEEPRASVRHLAARVGVTNETVTARLRRLRDLNVIATTVVVDAESAGYSAGAVVRIKAPKKSIDRLKMRFADSPDAQFVAAAVGACDLVVALLGVDLAGIRRTLRETLRDVENVQVLAVDVVSGTLAYDVNTLTLPIEPWSPDMLPAPRPSLDDLDRALLGELATAGHESNREIARRLNVSDATVRARVRRLEEGGLIRLVTGVDPVASGERQLFGMAFLALDDDAVMKESIEAHPHVSIVKTLGTADLVLQFGGRSVHELTNFVTGLADLDGVREVAIAYLTDVVAHQNHLARFT